MFLDNVIFHFYKWGGVTPLTGPPNLNGFSSIIRGGGEKSLLTNVNKKMFFFNEGFPYWPGLFCCSRGCPVQSVQARVFSVYLKWRVTVAGGFRPPTLRADCRKGFSYLSLEITIYLCQTSTLHRAVSTGSMSLWQIQWYNRDNTWGNTCTSSLAGYKWMKTRTNWYT